MVQHGWVRTTRHPGTQTDTEQPSPAPQPDRLGPAAASAGHGPAVITHQLLGARAADLRVVPDLGSGHDTRQVVGLLGTPIPICSQTRLTRTCSGPDPAAATTDGAGDFGETG
ncbi:hypothetical protein FJT64_022537 [Amphibalanus amphitrite]|uniref:Uncharacterized protein n=1 Tax=Amphibalanus amphitrite TaxID=1232801 RepID=A0A6A4WEU9_AMPAM|nr:hypothetical protein FJT64_022537 [Amphibalanus amphitrite]